MLLKKINELSVSPNMHNFTILVDANSKFGKLEDAYVSLKIGQNQPAWKICSDKTDGLKSVGFNMNDIVLPCWQDFDLFKLTEPLLVGFRADMSGS